MKVLVVNFEYPPLGGGGGVATMHLVQELVKFGHEMHVLTTWHKGLKREETVDGVRIHRVLVWGRRRLEAASLISLFGFVPMAWWTGWRLGRHVKFDVVNAQFVVPSGVVAVVLAKMWRVPLVVSLIGGDIYDPSKVMSPHRHWWMRIVVRWICHQAQALTAISRDTIQRARDLHGIKSEIEVVPIGIERKNLEVRQKKEDKKCLTAVTIGRLIVRKQCNILLEAWCRIENVKLVIIGSGPEAENLRRQADDLGINDKIVWAGFVSEEDKQRYLAEADMYVSAASHEGFGIVFLEAMAAGLPIVATNVGGQLDFLKEKKNALLVPVGDKDALIAAVNRLVNDYDLRTRMGENNSQKVQEYFWDKLAAQFEKVLNRVKKF
jgi:L-malate glycosyltransferase